MRDMDIDYSFDDIAPGGRIGLVALATDYNSETDLRRILPDGVDLFTNRVMNANPVTIENLRGMSGDITRAASGLLPGYGVDVVIYGCTSGTAAIGGDELQRLIQIAQPGVPCTNPILAASEALRAFNARKISILTPYTEDVNVAIKDSFGAEGFNILNIDGFGLEDDIEMTGMPLSAIAEAAVQICDPDADALFISCTAIRSALVVAELEQKLGKPVVTSNQALVWHCLKLMNNSSKVNGFGQLFDQ
ncbi:Asp/Glu racemase [Sneathiella chungangensis]|uniref:Asp/Glu racemase n=2 Tax=Sneathiella chungangensis TaxID=1418234 RepID=A0A845MIR8_9PROT|nr:Asp/Glu racemase [Sneathiella chungangensis]